jgi:hypothetical protein
MILFISMKFVNTPHISKVNKLQRMPSGILFITLRGKTFAVCVLSCSEHFSYDFKQNRKNTLISYGLFYDAVRV